MPQIIGLAVLPALLDWWAVFARRASIESVAKPLVMVLLIVGIIAGEPTTAGVWIASALAFSLVGDLVLLPKIDRFVLGLGSFLVAHLLFIVGFTIGSEGTTWLRVLVAAGGALLLAWRIGSRIIAAASLSSPSLRLPVTAYVLVLSVMLAGGIAADGWLVAAGAVLFAASDAVLGWNRFVGPIRHGRLLTHIPYHLGQGLIALWVIGL